LSFAAIASPGKAKVDVVAVLVDLAGTKPGLLVESVALVLGFLIFWVVLGCALLCEADKEMPRRSEDKAA
jgi:hypothetical protein